jgi:hypothetical protein
MEIRQYVIDHIKPLLPSGWNLVNHPDSLDVISKPVVMLKLQSVVPSPAAPGSAYLATYVLTVIEPKTDPGPAHDALDDKLLELLAALQTVPGLIWTNAEWVMFSDTNPAYDISLTVTLNKD